MLVIISILWHNFNHSKLFDFINSWQMVKATIKLCKTFFFRNINKNMQRKPWMKCFVHWRQFYFLYDSEFSIFYKIYKVTITTMLTIIFSLFTMFQYRFDLPQVKRELIFSMLIFAYKWPYVLRNGWILAILENKEILGESQNWVETQPIP